MVSSTSMSLSYANNDTSLFDRVCITPSAGDTCSFFSHSLGRTCTIISHPWRKKPLSQVSIRAVGHPEPLRRSTDEETSIPCHTLGHETSPMAVLVFESSTQQAHLACLGGRVGFRLACLRRSPQACVHRRLLLAHTISPAGVENPQLLTV